jgi:DNA-binding NarL/FixJ family response regulator
MADFTILAMTGDAKWLRRLHADLLVLGGIRIIVTESMDEACDLLDSAGARLLLVDLDPNNVTLEQVDRLLWMNSTVPHPAKVLTFSEEYSSGQALALFQMGVDEYICKSHHANQLPSIVSQLVISKPADTRRVERPVPVAARPSQAALPVSARWVAAAAPA